MAFPTSPSGAAHACPNCGDRLAPRFAATRMLTCPSCGTTLFLEDAAVRLAGQQGVLHELPSPVQLGQEFRAGANRLMPIGLLRYDYGRGTWDEYWCIDPSGDGVWLSVDEGDLVLQVALHPDRVPRVTQSALRPGSQIRYGSSNYTLTEMDTARLIGWRGELPEAVEMGEAHDFVNFSLGERLLSAEFWPGGQAWFSGVWIDPYDLRLRQGATA